MIDPSQSAFLHSCSILDSVTIVQEIISACTKYKWSAFFLKLDFAKAFDTMDWFFFHKVLQARGFGDRWCGWILSLLISGFSSVIVNGSTWYPVPMQTQIKARGSSLPIPFYLGVNVLSCMLKFAFEGGFAQKIWNRGFLVCNMRMILSYFSPLDLVSIKRVKILIYLFEMLSGLSINFHKSSLYQLGPSSLDLSQISDMLYCRLGRFPSLISVSLLSRSLFLKLNGNHLLTV